MRNLGGCLLHYLLTVVQEKMQQILTAMNSQKEQTHCTPLLLGL